jgi:hypothetical protein
MPKILLPNGATREVPFFNPGDVPAEGSSPLDRIAIAGEAPGGVSVAPVVNPGQDESAPETAVAPMFRHTTAPRYFPPTSRIRNTTRG